MYTKKGTKELQLHESIINHIENQDTACLIEVYIQISTPSNYCDLIYTDWIHLLAMSNMNILQIQFSLLQISIFFQTQIYFFFFVVNINACEQREKREREREKE